MNLEDLQSYVAGLLAAEPVFSAAGLAVGTGIILDDGTYPKVPGREEALRTLGLCITVGDPDYGMADSVRGGTSKVLCDLVVGVEENVRVNQSATGTGIAFHAAIRKVIQRVSGKPADAEQNLQHAQTINHGIENGVRLATVRFGIRQVFTPA